MQKIDEIIALAGHKKSDLSVCMGCRVCASVCTVNDLGTDPHNVPVTANPQELLLRLFLGQEILERPSADGAHGAREGVARPGLPGEGATQAPIIVRYCTSCYRCADACPWKIRIPEIVRGLREHLHIASPFETAFKGSLKIWGRVYEPYVFLMSVPFLMKEGYIKHMMKWTEYMSIHLPHKVKERT